MILTPFGAFSQVKRCAEMSRKLRFFKDQIGKAGLLSSMRPVIQPDIELEELEVIIFLWFRGYHVYIPCNLGCASLRFFFLKYTLLIQKKGIRGYYCSCSTEKCFFIPRLGL
jgi:hypothetical protein